MASNLTVLSQYVTSLHRMSTEVMQSVFGRGFFPSGAIDDAAPVPHVHHASTKMAAMGLWRPPISPGGPELDTTHYDENCPGCTECLQRLSGWTFRAGLIGLPPVLLYAFPRYKGTFSFCIYYGYIYLVELSFLLLSFTQHMIVSHGTIWPD